MTRSVLVRTAWIAGVGMFAGFGLWMFASPRSFYTALATYPPLHVHFLRDAGAFNIGLGAGLLAALRFKDALATALVAAATASVFHVASHVIDIEAGGKPSDPWLLGLFALVMTAGAMARLKEVSR